MKRKELQIIQDRALTIQNLSARMGQVAKASISGDASPEESSVIAMNTRLAAIEHEVKQLRALLGDEA